jgi:hypothetical protein
MLGFAPGHFNESAERVTDWVNEGFDVNKLLAQGKVDGNCLRAPQAGCELLGFTVGSQ